jgi:hypothetical protein
MYSIYLLEPLLDFELYNIEELEANQHEDDEVYYEETDLSGGVEGIRANPELVHSMQP